MKNIIFSFLLMLSVTILNGAAIAAFDNKPNQMVKEGVVKYINNQMITIVQGDPSGDPNAADRKEYKFLVDSHTQFQKAAGIDRIKEGDRVKVTYTETTGKRVATAVSLIEDLRKNGLDRRACLISV